AVPGSPKVTRCTSKPAPLRIFSSTPSAPASAGVTEGQRSRSRAMERAEGVSRMSPLNMRLGRWASAVRDKFRFAELIPVRGCARTRIDGRPRIGAEPVRRACALQQHQLDKAPKLEPECDQHEQLSVRLVPQQLVNAGLGAG